MLDLFQEFATDTKAEDEGVWEPYSDEVSFLIGRTHNKRYDATITSLVAKHKRQLDAKTDASRAKSEELMIETMAKTILLDWKGDFNFQGQLMGPYTVDKAKKLLAVKDFRAWVSNIADDMERFKVASKEEDAEK